ncbi:hypothetical protein KUTeg_013484 [Tegillarca granosa]|uniref:C2 Aida-type domain-containing protein n=1 Tax=Tegillarca granosa TaxID=220873 RepID=A0ABQ9EYZ2_TEGGR|nr:hypothetical protein KUTeg_013484 [Tegillarca granosa]
MTDLGSHDEVISEWHKAFKRATDFDLWGQPVEAIDGYQRFMISHDAWFCIIYFRLSKQLQQFSSPDSTEFTDEQKKIFGKIAICLDLRCKALQNVGIIEGISLDDLKKIGTTLKNVLSQRCKDFPVDVTAAQLQVQTFNNSQYSQAQDADEGVKGKGSLLPRVLPYGGLPTLTVRIEKIALKEATQFIDPYITVTVKDQHGNDLTALQDTPTAHYKESGYIIFNVNVHIQKVIDSFPPGFGIFFEFKHYKPKKKIVSTKCWAVLEKDEIKEGPVVLEL